MGLPFSSWYCPKPRWKASLCLRPASAAPRFWSSGTLAFGPSLNYYFGAGAHFGRHRDDGPFWGLDGLVGVEYKIAFLPVVLALDFKPTIEYGSADWNRFPTAVSVRYIFIKQKKTGIFRALDKL